MEVEHRKKRGLQDPWERAEWKVDHLERVNMLHLVVCTMEITLGAKMINGEIYMASVSLLVYQLL